MADEEEDDAVAHEVDVFLAKSLAENLYLLQYPVRPSEVSYDHVPHIGARIKPKQQKVEIELALNTSGRNYYEPRGEQIAADVDRHNKEANRDLFYASDLMDKQVLVSARGPVDALRYAVGVLKEGELHLTPCHGVLQMRPNLQYMDKAETNTRQSHDEVDSQDEEEDAKAVTVRFARPETAKAKAQRMSSFKYLEKKEAEEQWVPLQYYPPQHSMAALDKAKLYCRDINIEAPEMCVTTREYLKLLTPSSSKEESSRPEMPNNVLSMTQLKTMDLPDQVKALLINAKLMSFSQLCTLLAPTAKEAVVLRHVQQYGHLIQGCWVVKSELLYPEGTVSPNSGIPSDILCRGRDYVMWKFTQHRVVVRKDIAAVAKLPNEDIKEMLEQMSKMRVAQGWEFLLPCDTEFIHKHPDVYKQQQTNWEAKYHILASQLNLPKTHAHEKGSAEHKEHKKAQDGSHEVQESKRIRKTSKTEVNHVIHDNKPSSNQLIKKNMNHTSNQVTPMEVDHNDDNKVHYNDTQVITPDSEHYEEIVKRLQDFVCEKLHKTVLSFADFKRLLLLKQTACPPGDVLCSGISDSLLEDAILTTGAVELDVKWPVVALRKDLNSRKLYAFRTTGDEATDKVRGVLLDMFSKKHCVKKAEFVAKVTEVTGSAPGKKDWPLLCQDLLEKFKSQYTVYCLRGTSALFAEL